MGPGQWSMGLTRARPLDGGIGFAYAAPMVHPDEMWAPAVVAFPDHEDMPQIVGVTEVEGLLVAPPPQLRGLCTAKKGDCPGFG